MQSVADKPSNSTLNFAYITSSVSIFEMKYSQSFGTGHSAQVFQESHVLLHRNATVTAVKGYTGISRAINGDWIQSFLNTQHAHVLHKPALMLLNILYTVEEAGSRGEGRIERSIRFVWGILLKSLNFK